MPFTFNRPGWRCPGLPRPRSPVKFATDDSLLVFLVPDRQDDCLRGNLWRNVVRADRQRARVNRVASRIKVTETDSLPHG